MSDDLLDDYFRTLERYAVPFKRPEAPGYWHLTVFDITAERPEIIWDFDSLGTRTLAYRTSLYPSLWRSILSAKGNPGEVARVEVERACEVLSSDSPICQLVDGERIFHLTDGHLEGVDGTILIVSLTAYECETMRRRCWDPLRHEGTGWRELVDAIAQAAKALPRSKRL